MTLSTEQQSKNEDVQQMLHEASLTSSDDIGWMFDGLSELKQQAIQRKIDWVLRVRDARKSGDKASAREMTQAAAADLGCHPRTVKRMLDAVDADGIIALTRDSRADKGKARYISEPWRKLVIELYKRGNRCSRRTNRNQIWLLIKALTPKVKAAITQSSDDLDAQFTWIATKLGSADESHSSNLNQILREIKQEVLTGTINPPRSHVAVYKILEEYSQKQNKKARHSGQGPIKTVQTTEGDIVIDRSNKVLQIDHTRLDVLLVDQEGHEIGCPFLSVATDSYSGCIAGFYLGFRQPSSHEVALVLRHVILRKEYGPEFKLQHEWGVCGVPEYLFTDRAKEFKSEHLQQVAAQLDFSLRKRAYPEQGGIVESIFDKLNKEVLSRLPGYKGSNVQKRPKDAEKYASVTLEELEKILVRHFVDHVNQHAYPRVAQTRFERWESMMIEPPRIPDERTLDICLLKQKKRPKVQKYGTIAFEGEIYKGDCLLGKEKQQVVIRYNPANIIHLLVYTDATDGKPGTFLGTVRARDLPEERLSLKELKERRRRLQEARKSMDISSIMSERLDLNEFSEEKAKETRKQKREKEHKRTKRSDGLCNVVDFKRHQSISEREAIANKTTVSEPPPKEATDQKPKRKRFKPSESAEVAASNWHEYRQHNW